MTALAEEQLPWEKTYNRDMLLDSAARIFWSRGYHGASMAELVRASGVNRGSLYTAFEDKRSLYRAALDFYIDAYTKPLLDSCARAGKSGAVAALFEAAQTADPNLPGGCFLINAAVDQSPQDFHVAASVRAGLDLVQDFISAQQKAGSKSGPTARSLLAQYVGLRVMMRSGAQSGLDLGTSGHFMI